MQARRYSSATNSTRSPTRRRWSATRPARSSSERNLATGESRAVPSPARLGRDLEPGQALGPERLGPVGQGVEPRPGASTPRPPRTMAFTHGAAKARNLGAGEHGGQVDQLHAEADVGLVGAVAVHGLGPRHRGDRRPGARRWPPRRRRARPRRRSSRTSSWETNDASMSSWVNSNCRSARRSSSRRQRAIWK